MSLLKEYIDAAGSRSEFWNDTFNYKDGKLYWKANRAQRVKAGDRAGSNATRYEAIMLLGTKVYSHRIIFEMFNGDTDLEVDHIDGNTFNNLLSNLRECTRAENTRNVGKRKDNKSGYKGVSWSKQRNKWIAQINIEKKRHLIGAYDTAKEASVAYNKKAKELHSTFMRCTNE
jgi:hypothetical protein